MPLIGDYSPPLSRDFCRLFEGMQKMYNSDMTTFRVALISHLNRTGVSLRKVADGSGVSYEQLKKLKQVEDRTTNVEDAMRVARFFGMTVEEFILGKKSTSPLEIVQILSRLSPQSREVLSNAAKAQLDAEASAPGKSGKGDPQSDRES